MAKGIYEVRPARRPLEPGESPFDAIKHVDPDGSEWWSARELGKELGYKSWQRIEGMLARAMISCRRQGHDPADHFENFNSAVKVPRPASRGPIGDDVRLSRFGCYMTSINGDVRKPEIAAAQGYFVVETRANEMRTVKQVPGAWSVRFREFMPHFSEVNINHPGDFTVVTALVPFFLRLEDELDRHLLPTRTGDLPDGSVGRCWANDRFLRGMDTPKCRARLYLPARGHDVSVCVYGVDERGPFESWFINTYVPEKLPNYLGNKPSLNFDGPLPPASVALHTCRDWTGGRRRPHLNPRVSKQLDMVGGFAPVGTKVPQLGRDQPTLFK